MPRLQTVVSTTREGGICSKQICNLLYGRVVMSNGWLRYLCSKEENASEIKIPEAPTNCCMSGCPNCVWIEYAEQLSKIFKDSGDKAKEIILRNVDDENMKAFLQMQLDSLKRLEGKNDTDS